MNGHHENHSNHDLHQLLIEHGKCCHDHVKKHPIIVDHEINHDLQSHSLQNVSEHKEVKTHGT